jgi:hypothetical protein
MPMTIKPFKKGDKIPSSSLSYRPEWSLGDFFTTMEQWNELKPTDAPAKTWDISASEGKKADWASFNLDKKAAESGNDLFLVVSKSSSKQDTTKSESGLSNVLDDVKLSLSFQEIGTFDISAGDWAGGDLDSYNTMQGLEWEEYIKPDTLLIGVGPSLDVQFGDKANKAFEESYKKTSDSSDTGLRILGMQITGSKNEKSVEDRSASGEAHYDKSTGVHVNLPNAL